MALREIGHDLGRTFSATLLDNAETELTRLVEDHAQVLRRVITSYSIHYTKLYDG